MMNNLFSVAIVTYNQRNLLEMTLASVFTQDYPNIQLIVCDNESCDFDPIEVEGFIRANKSEKITDVVVLRQEHHVSDSSNAEYARKAANGVYFKLINGGDMLAPHALIEAAESFKVTLTEAVVTKYQRCPYDAKYVLSSTNTEKVTDNEAALLGAHSECLPPEEYFFKDNSPRELLLKYSGNGCKACTFELIVYWRMETLEALGGYDENYAYLIEWPVLLKLCTQEKAIIFIDEVSQYVRDEISSDWWKPMSMALGRPKLVESAKMLHNIVEPYILNYSQGEEKKRLLRRCRVVQETLQLSETIQCDWDGRNVPERAFLKLKYWKSLLYIWFFTWRARNSIQKDLLILLSLILISRLDFGVFACGVISKVIRILVFLFVFLSVFHLLLAVIRKLSINKL